MATLGAQYGGAVGNPYATQGPQFAPQGFLGDLAGAFGGQLGGALGGAFGNPQLGQQLGGALGGLAQQYSPYSAMTPRGFG